MGKYSDVEALLIEEVRKYPLYPVLWNTSNPNYKNRTKKENAWIAVSVSVNDKSTNRFTVERFLGQHLAHEKKKVIKSFRSHSKILVK